MTKQVFAWTPTIIALIPGSVLSLFIYEKKWDNGK